MPAWGRDERLLWRKLLRDLVRERARFLVVVAVVALGTATFGAMYVAAQNLDQATADYYQRLRFADLTVHVRSMPRTALAELAQERGVDQVDGRLVVDVPLETGDRRQRITARLIGIPVPYRAVINDVTLHQGRRPHHPRRPEALIHGGTRYFGTHDLGAGDVVRPIVNGRPRNLRIVGTAAGPEFIVPVRSPLDLFNLDTSFVVLYVPHDLLADWLGYDRGRVNQVLVRYAGDLPAADRERLRGRIEAFLDPYGVEQVVPRSDQLSHQILDAEISQLQAMASVIPLLFYLAASMVLYNLLLRLIQAQRVQIGVLRALGYGAGAILRHYAAFGLLVAVVGSAAGIGMGWSTAGFFTHLYASFFNIPVLRMGLHLNVAGAAFVVSAIFSMTAAYVAVRGTTRESPADLLRRSSAESLRLPAWYRRIGAWLGHLALPWRLAIRNVLRSPRRSLMTVVGVTFSVALMFGTFFFIDAMDYMVRTDLGERQAFDVKAAFARPLAAERVRDLGTLPGVTAVEPLLEMPVTLRANGVEEQVVLVGVPAETSMIELFGAGERPFRLPRAGVAVNVALLEALGLRVGDSVVIETIQEPKERYTVRVTGAVGQMVGTNAYMDLEALWRMLGQGQAVTGAHLRTQPHAAERVRAALLDLPGVHYALSPRSFREAFERYTVLGWSMMVAYVVLSGSLGFAIVFNTTQLNILERRRELAGMRILGLSVSQVGRTLLYENVLLTAVGYVAGMPLGRWMVHALVDSAASELYHLPPLIYPRTYVLVAVTILAFGALPYLSGRRMIQRLSLVELVKVHES